MACRGYPFWAPDEKALAQRERRAEVAADAAKSRVAKAKPIKFGTHAVSLSSNQDKSRICTCTSGYRLLEF